MADASCSGLVQLNWQCESGDQPCDSAFLKSVPPAYLQGWQASNGSAYPDCVTVAPYANTYLFPDRQARLGSGAEAGKGGTNAGAIAGGEQHA